MKSTCRIRIPRSGRGYRNTELRCRLYELLPGVAGQRDPFRRALVPSPGTTFTGKQDLVDSSRAGQRLERLKGRIHTRLEGSHSTECGEINDDQSAVLAVSTALSRSAVISTDNWIVQQHTREQLNHQRHS